MVGKKRAREEGLQRTDNNMEQTSWPQVNMINQKNYYNEYLKRDDQILVLRLQNEDNRNRMARAARDRDRTFAQSSNPDATPAELDIDNDDTMAADDGTEENQGSKIIVLHPGSQNLRIGLASDALPKTVPMVIARQAERNEAEEGDDEPKPKRNKTEDGALQEPEKLFESDFAAKFTSLATELTARLRRKGHRVIPQSRPQAIGFNKKNPPKMISEHNDAHRIDWTEISDKPGSAPEYVVGQPALRIPDYSTPRYKLFWPLKYGVLNEEDYSSTNQLLRDFSLIIEDAIKTQLGLERKKDWAQYDCVFVIPDLYERSYVTTMLDMLLRVFGFNRVCFIQESLSGSFGAGYSTCVIVDVGAQKTSICCVDEGMCLENSRITLRYGGSDVTDLFVKTLFFDVFPYSDMNLRRRYDFLLAEELKQSLCTLSFADLRITQSEFHLRAFGQSTRHYNFRTYDAIRMGPMGFYRPEMFDNTGKLKDRRKLIPRSYDLYDGSPNDPLSAAQNQIYAMIAPQEEGQKPEDASTKSLEGSKPDHSPSLNGQTPSKPSATTSDFDSIAKPSYAGSPAAHDEHDTPQQARANSPTGGEKDALSSQVHPVVDLIHQAEGRDRILPIMPLDKAIMLSIEHGARGDERKMRDFYGGIIPTGGGAQTDGFNRFLEEELQEAQVRFKKDIIVGQPPREIDPQVLVWKGASVFGKLRGTNDSWISGMEYDRLGNRLLAYKCLWGW